MEFYRPEYCSGSLSVLQGIEPRPPAWQADSLPAEPQGTPSSRCLIEFPCETIRSCAFVCWELFNQFHFQYLWLACSHFLFLPGSVLEDCTFLSICQFLLGFSVVFAYSGLQELFMVLCIPPLFGCSGVSVVMCGHLWLWCAGCRVWGLRSCNAWAL